MQNITKGNFMDRHLNLIKNETSTEEKRVLPRFPFCYLTFKLKDEKGEISRAFEVKDISFTGMRIELKNGDIGLNKKDEVSGTLHWSGVNSDIGGRVVWISGNQLGVEFIKNPRVEENIKTFLSIENIVKQMKPLHQTELGLELPANLKYWLRADGPMEIFVWCHSDGELSKIQFVFMDIFVEWEDGQGLKSGVVTQKKSLDTPLINEDEFTFQIDEPFDEAKLQFASKVTSLLTDKHMTQDAISFLKRKFSR